MASWSSQLHSLAAPILAGVVAHAVSHHYPPASIRAFASVLFLPPTALSFSTSSPSSLLSFLGTLLLYLTSLGSSIALYRLSPFHPLSKYPGPVLARVSRLWATRHAASGRQHVIYHELFERYGEVVRTGPDHLIMRNASGIPVILGARNPWPKHPRYSLAVPYDAAGSLGSQIDPVDHGRRRRIWDRAFTPAAVKSYRPLLHNRLVQLTEQLDARVSKPLDLAEWMSFLSVDFMGDFAYGGMFNSVTQGVDHAGVHDAGVVLLGASETLGTLPWLRPIVARLIQYRPPAFRDLAIRVVESRQEKGTSFRDLFYYLLNEDGEGTHPPLNRPTLAGEAMLALVAGSDTTGTALANAMYYLMTHPDCMSRLRAELDCAAGEGTAYDIDIEEDKLVDLKYLQAVINETLRLQPALPNGAQRMPPHNGGPVVVAGHVIPVGTTVQIPTWSLHRDTRYFLPNPEAFWPERWLPEGMATAQSRGQEFKLDQTAYMPFSYGPTNCVGRLLALHEMRTVLAVLVRRFDARLAPGCQPEDWLRQLRDHYALVRGKLDVVLSKRSM